MESAWIGPRPKQLAMEGDRKRELVGARVGRTAAQQLGRDVGGSTAHERRPGGGRRRGVAQRQLIGEKAQTLRGSPFSISFRSLLLVGTTGSPTEMRSASAGTTATTGQPSSRRTAR